MKDFFDDGRVIADMSCFRKCKDKICHDKKTMCSFALTSALAALTVAAVFIGSAFLFVWFLTRLWK